MSARTEIDSLRFAQSGDSLSGEFPVASFERLRDMLVSTGGGVAWRLSGVTESGRPALKLVVAGELRLLCQRCLMPCLHELRLESVMPVARSEGELDVWERDDSLLDALVAETHLDVQTLVEDEILLSLPAVPRHADGACGQAGGH